MPDLTGSQTDTSMWWYQPDYYGAFVFDPDGINVEAVCHRPE